MLDCYLTRLFSQDRAFFLPRPANDRFHAANVRCDLVIPSFSLLAPPASSPSPDANGGIDLQGFDALNCSTLRLLRVDQIQKGESKAF